MVEKNHIFLVMRFTEELMGLARHQRWIDLTRKQHSRNKHVQEVLDRQQRQIVARKIEISDQMFEIQISN